MKRTKRVFSSAFKAEVALEAIKGVKTVSELAQAYELHPAPEREGFEPNAPICSISVIYEDSFR